VHRLGRVQYDAEEHLLTEHVAVHKRLSSTAGARFQFVYYELRSTILMLVISLLTTCCFFDAPTHTTQPPAQVDLIRACNARQPEPPPTSTTEGR
jgi:hypothetical protein